MGRVGKGTAFGSSSSTAETRAHPCTPARLCHPHDLGRQDLGHVPAAVPEAVGGSGCQGCAPAHRHTAVAVRDRSSAGCNTRAGRQAASSACRACRATHSQPGDGACPKGEEDDIGHDRAQAGRALQRLGGCGPARAVGGRWAGAGELAGICKPAHRQRLLRPGSRPTHAIEQATRRSIGWVILTHWAAA